MRKVRALKPSKTGQKVTGRGLRSQGQGELEGESYGFRGAGEVVEDTKEVDKRNEAPSHTEHSGHPTASYLPVALAMLLGEVGVRIRRNSTSGWVWTTRVA